ncbi:MAG: HYR domain-containing protein, partial [Bacteroidales bacterium]|nr:HYR domain-containing protein [Bacteroidales bacterium]
PGSTTAQIAGLASGSAFPVGTTTNTFEVTDASGNTAQCSFTVTVNDDEDPTVTNCPSNIIVNNDPGICGAVVNYAAPTFDDNCDGSGLSGTMTSGLVSGSLFPVGVTTVTYTYTDLAGNGPATCTFTVTVNDNEDPIITCPAGSPFTRGTDASGCYYVIQGSEFNPTFSDNCPGATIQNNYNNTNTLANDTLLPGVTTIAWSVTDAYGHMANCVIIINVIDDTPPVITCPPDTTVDCPSDIPVPNIGLVSAVDNCDFVSISHLNDVYQGLGIYPGFCPTAVERTYAATDQEGNTTNCLRLITVADVCDCATCQDTVPHFFVDLSGDPNGSWTSPSVQRVGLCCEATSPHRCVSFSVMIGEQSIGIYFLIDGATPQGHYYQIDCGPELPMDEIVCLTSGEYHTITFCKPGANNNVYTIHAIPGLIITEEISTRVECEVELTVSGVEESTVTWNDITGGGIYNSYLSCTSGCLTTYFTPDEFAPPIIDYLVCGEVADNPCDSTGLVCDTVRVHIFPEVEISIYPDPPSFCDYDPHTIYVSVTPPGLWDIEWYDGPDGTGNIVSTGNEYTPATPGFYSIIVYDTNTAIPCSLDTLNFEIVLDDCIPICTEQYYCPGGAINTYATVSEFIAAGGVVDFPCFVPDANISLINQVSDGNYCPEIITHTYQIWDSCGNNDICDAIITYNDTLPPTLTCPGDLTAVCDVTEQPAYTTLAEFIGAGGDTLDNCGIEVNSFFLQSEVSDGLTCPETVT